MNKPDREETNRLINVAQHLVTGFEMMGQTNMAEHIKQMSTQLAKESDYAHTMCGELGEENAKLVRSTEREVSTAMKRCVKVEGRLAECKSELRNVRGRLKALERLR